MELPGTALPPRMRPAIDVPLAEDTAAAEIKRLAKESAQLFKDISSELRFHPSINLLILRFAFKVQYDLRNMESQSKIKLFFWKGLLPLLKVANPALLEVKNIDELKALAELMADLWIKIEEAGRNAADIFDRIVTTFLEDNPALLQKSNIKTLGTLFEICLKAVKHHRDIEPEVLLQTLIFGVIVHNPSLLTPENRGKLEEITGALIDIGTRAAQCKFGSMRMFGWIERFCYPRKIEQLLDRENGIKAYAEMFFSISKLATAHRFDTDDIYNEIDRLKENDKAGPRKAGFNRIIWFRKVYGAIMGLLGNDIYPSCDLVCDILKGKRTMESVVERYMDLSRRVGHNGGMDMELDLELLYSVLKRTISHPGGLEREKMRELGFIVTNWVRRHPKYRAIKNDLPPFRVFGKGDVEIKETDFDGALIDGLINTMELDIFAERFSVFGFLFGSPLSAEERSWFLKRVLAYMQVSDAKAKGKLPKDFTINSLTLKRHIVGRYPANFQKSDRELMAEIIPRQAEMLPAIYFVCVSAHADATKKKETEKMKFYERVIKDLLLKSAIYADEQLSEILLHSGSYRSKLDALTQVYRDRLQHLPDTTVPMPKEVSRTIGEMFAELRGEYQKIGQAHEQENIQEYNIVPAGIEALFRGYIGVDCAKDKDVPLWAFNPNNMYYLIMKGRQVKGYIGLTKTLSPGGRRVLLIDTMNPCPPGLVEPILSTLKRISTKHGYSGIGIGTQLDGSFNYEEVRQAIKDAKPYRNGEDVMLLPEDRKSWRYFEEKIGLDVYHTLKLTRDHVLLKF